MANPDGDESHGRRRRRRRSSVHESGHRRHRGDIEGVQNPTREELRTIRTNIYQDGTPRQSTTTMPSTILRSSTVSKPSKHRRRHTTDVGRSSRRRGDDAEYVYSRKRPTDETLVEVSDEENGQREEGQRTKVVYVEDRRHGSSSRERREERPLHRSTTTTTRKASPIELLKRTLSSRDVSNTRPPLSRNRSSQTSTKVGGYESSVATGNTRRSSFMGMFTQPARPSKEARAPPRLVECLTCMSDDIPHAKSAKLKCGHRMCHACLKRIFRLSIHDPQHMPPKCCTVDHIPLKHVDKLFDNSFKMTWNKRFAEYTTKNRIYCPARKCGEWIRPANIHTERESGRKYGKCGTCKTKVCCLCNGKWHGSKECPKDEATNQLLEAAKQAGWQRCWSCRTMVELKEGCNHMTCRCTAEFCMLCGLKWKTCNCPWFNYDAVEADRLRHMRIPHARVDRQEEEIIRQFDGFGFENYNNDAAIHGVGILDHHMNETYQRPAPRPNPAYAAANYVMGVARERAGFFGQAGPPRVAPAPLLRRPIAARDDIIQVEEYNSRVRPSERVIPRRARNDYLSEAAVHVPAREPPRRRERVFEREIPKDSVLAGLPGRGSGRVSQWRSHVEPTEPEEGVLNHVVDY